MGTEERPDERIDDKDKAREMAKASDFAHLSVTTEKSKLSDFGLEDSERQALKKSLKYWEAEAESDETIAAALYDTRNEIKGLSRDKIKKLLQDAEAEELRIKSIRNEPQNEDERDKADIIAEVRTTVIKNALEGNTVELSARFKN